MKHTGKVVPDRKLTTLLPERVYLKLEFPASGPIIRANASLIQPAFSCLVIKAIEALEDRDQRERAIGIVLSGTGSDGTQGVRAIKIRKGIRDLIPEGQREEVLAVVQQLARAEVLEPYRAQRLAKDGRIVEVWITATTLVKDAAEI